jgi:hypothetical protein
MSAEVGDMGTLQMPEASLLLGYGPWPKSTTMCMDSYVCEFLKIPNKSFTSKKEIAPTERDQNSQLSLIYSIPVIFSVST